MLTDWKKSVEGQWSSQRECLASACEEWESNVKTVETDLSTTQAWLVLSAACPGVWIGKWGGYEVFVGVVVGVGRSYHCLVQSMELEH